jgi:hypothetical protein
MRTMLKWFGIVMACLVVCVVLLFVTFEWWGKSIIAQQASALWVVKSSWKAI